MGLSKSTCLETFLAAWSELARVVASPRATATQGAEARLAQNELTHNFIRDKLDSLEARTVLFEEFIEKMQAVVTSLSGDGPLAPIKALQRIVDEAKAALPEPEEPDESEDSEAPDGAANDEA